jgi:hypothetical protein
MAVAVALSATLALGGYVAASAASLPAAGSVLRGPGREGMLVQQQAVGEALYVIPADVAPLVPDVLDRDLFDVMKLADMATARRSAELHGWSARAPATRISSARSS